MKRTACQADFRQRFQRLHLSGPLHRAVSIGYAAEDPLLLRWLAQEQGVILRGRTFLCWNPQGRRIAGPTAPLLRLQKPAFRPSEYKEALKETLASRKLELEVTDGVVRATFDAATTGRLSLTYYNELQAHDFLRRLCMRGWLNRELRT